MERTDKENLYSRYPQHEQRGRLINTLREKCRQALLHKEVLFNEVETGAIVTHFLQSPDGRTPLINQKLRHEFIRCMMDFQTGERVLSAEEAITELPLINTLNLFNDLPYAPPKNWDFTFIDLFAGIGGFRIAFQHAGGKCVFSSEWDKYAKKTYEANYGEIPYGDIRLIPKEQIPAHDVLCAGFPCQPFSLAGISKKNSLGKKHGFEDETQGTLFFEIKEILRIKRPKAFMLENVKNLLAHDHGKTFEIIRRSLEDDLGYVINYKIVNGAAWVPQHRERLYLMGFDPRQISITKDEIQIPDRPGKSYRYPYLSSIILKHIDGYTLGPGTWHTLQRHKKHHEEAGHGFGYGLLTWPINKETVTRTISARYHKDGAEILVEQPGARPRKLSVEEAMQLQGFSPEKFRFPVSPTQAYHQIGNSVVVPAVKDSALFLAQILKERTQ